MSAENLPDNKDSKGKDVDVGKIRMSDGLSVSFTGRLRSNLVLSKA